MWQERSVHSANEQTVDRNYGFQNDELKKSQLKKSQLFHVNLTRLEKELLFESGDQNTPRAWANQGVWQWGRQASERGNRPGRDADEMQVDAHWE